MWRVSTLRKLRTLGVGQAAGGRRAKVRAREAKGRAAQLAEGAQVLLELASTAHIFEHVQE